MTIAATASDIGIAVSEMMVVRQFHKNKKRMMATKMAPSRRAIETLSTAVSMKSA